MKSKKPTTRKRKTTKRNRTVIKKAQRVVVLNKAKRNPKASKGKKSLKRAGSALKGAARSLLGAGSEILGAGAAALNPRKPRRRNKAARVSEADISKFPAHVQRQLRAQLGQIEKREVKAKTPVQRKAVAKSRRSFLARLGTRLKLAGQTKKIKVSARDLDRCPRKTVKVRARHETDALAKAQSKLGRDFDQFKVGNPGKRRNAAKKTVAKRIATGEGWDFWKIGDDVYRARIGAEMDTYGLPMGRRWESSYVQFQQYRDSVFGWAKPVGMRNPSPESIRKRFAGSVSGHRELYFPQGTPRGLAKLGKLVSITTEEGVIKPVHGTAWLCADTAGKLHIGSVSPSPLFDGPKRSFGKVSKVEYEDVKKHLGYTKPTIFFHHVGEENGIKPTLHADGQGGLIFKGGAYRVTSRGLEN